MTARYGCLVAYTIAIGDILQPVLELPSFAHAFPWLTKDATICIFWLFLCLPLSCVRDISSLQFTSLFGVMALGYLVLAVAIHFGFDAAADWRDTVGEANWVNHASLTDAVSAMGILMFAFSCQVCGRLLLERAPRGHLLLACNQKAPAHPHARLAAGQRARSLRRALGAHARADGTRLPSGLHHLHALLRRRRLRGVCRRTRIRPPAGLMSRLARCTYDGGHFFR